MTSLFALAFLVAVAYVAMIRIERMRPQKRLAVKPSRKPGRRVPKQPAMRQTVRVAAQPRRISSRWEPH